MDIEFSNMLRFDYFFELNKSNLKIIDNCQLEGRKFSLPLKFSRSESN